ncbi:MAG: right-handed parallel beta-helix repeat-containing protein [Parcubacteria group bacterium]|jgi:hypothetical protein
MPKLSQFGVKSKQIKDLIFVAAMLVIVVPSWVFSSHTTKIYVDDDASGVQDGSSEHPYKTIKKAMEGASKNAEIHIAKGTYAENVDLKEGVEIYGESMTGVVIKAGDSDEAVVTMADDTVLNKVTVKDGRYGVRVKNDAKASISKCLIKNNSRNGVFIEKDGVKKSRMVSVSNSKITDNDGTGVYAQKRRLSLTENEIHNNDGDGVDIEGGSIAWIADNKINDNDKSGMKLRVDGSEIWTKSNSIRNNQREGVEISFKGGVGRIDIAKTKIIGNKRYGVARVQRFVGNAPVAAWNRYLTLNANNTIADNNDGNISPVIIIN